MQLLATLRRLNLAHTRLLIVNGGEHTVALLDQFTLLELEQRLDVLVFLVLPFDLKVVFV